MVAEWKPGESSPSRGPVPEMPELGKQFDGSRTRHGTHSGWAKHQKLAEEPCESCRKAKAAYDYRRLSATEQRRKNRLSATAQSRARAELARRHPDEYRTIYEAEKRELGL